MIVITSIEKMKKWRRLLQGNGKSIGLVPTMGSIHEGHLSLIKASISKCDYTVVSIFVNPTQFGPNEDYKSYPRDLESDKNILQNAGIDVLFYPNYREIYPNNFQTFITVQDKTKYLCGVSRPNFFQGVTTIVFKLFSIVNPNTAYFGEKDWQQLEVVRTMVKDLNLDVKIISKPIIREVDGLAISSRNQYLSSEERENALILSQSLESAKTLIIQGERSTEIIRTKILQMVVRKNKAKVDYISVCDPESFKEKKEITPRTLIALAVWIGKLRLIDNLIIERT